ncbi:major capsid protein [Mycobacterium sp. KBS0706]|uniref:major capsid protein n=1 Tax=Mycobacterium sp. KBS0706 TaxID=2578109 RepID=UPI00110FA391|nr:major capsid protein [Mycobacterium sp. KBS0706]TSD89074.1 major capsid protein [Mycobacterium sp. KBS0706]
MATMDIFNQDAFSMVSMTQAITRTPYQPRRLGALGLFTPHPITTTAAAIEEMNGTLKVIQTDQRGAPIQQRGAEKRNLRYFGTRRIAKGDTIRAEEIQGIRAFGSETELMQVQAEVARRLDGPVGIRRDVELTKENMRLGAVQGIVLDADGSVIYNWFTEWGVSQPAEVAFDLNNASPTPGALRKKCNDVVRKVTRGAKGMMVQGSGVHALCGDDFWDALITHPDVEKTYLNWEAAANLREGTAWQAFNFGGISWENYRGTDDGTTVAVATDKVKFFPDNAPGVFEEINSPAESFEYVNTPGMPEYSMIVPDQKRNMFVDVEVYSYPLFICTTPGALQRGKIGA